MQVGGQVLDVAAAQRRDLRADLTHLRVADGLAQIAEVLEADERAQQQPAAADLVGPAESAGMAEVAQVPLDQPLVAPN